MAEGKGTHSTENRLELHQAVESALGHAGVPFTGVEALSTARDRFLTRLRDCRHVVGHITDRHLELQARCTQLLLLWDIRDDGPAAEHAAAALDEIVEGIREIVDQPEHPAPRPFCRTPDVPAGRYMCGLYLPCPKHGPHDPR